jgi:hypothetical protein
MLLFGFWDILKIFTVSFQTVSAASTGNILTTSSTLPSMSSNDNAKGEMAMYTHR